MNPFLCQYVQALASFAENSPNLQSTLCSFEEKVPMQGIGDKGNPHSVKMEEEYTMASCHVASQYELCRNKSATIALVSKRMSNQKGTTQKGV